MTSRVLHWLADSGTVPHWAICMGSACVFFAAIEVAVVVTLWLEGRKFEREHRG